MKRQHNDSLGLQKPAEYNGELTGWQAVNLALNRSLAADPGVFILGEDVGLYGGSYRCTQGLYGQYGEWRVRDAPISEGGFTGLGVGAALAGARPVIEIMTINFALLALDAIVNMAAKLRYMSGGQFSVPLVVRTPGGVAKQLAAQHSQRLEHTLMNVPGLRLVVPGSVQDMYSQLRQAILHDDPIIVLEHELMYFEKGPFKDQHDELPLHAARVCREGKDITLVAWSHMVAVCLAAADRLAQDNIDVEVIDLRSLRPIDLPCIQHSVKKTHKAMVVEEDCRFAGAGAEIVAELQERSFFDLDGPVTRVAAADVPTPYNAELERQSIPSVDSVIQAVRSQCLTTPA